MAAKQARLKLAFWVVFMLGPLGLFGFSLLAKYGKTGSWAFPTLLAFIVIAYTVALVLGIRAERARTPES